MRASTSAWLSGESFGGVAGCCAVGGVGGSAPRRFTGTSEAAAETIAARRANSRREIADSFLFSMVELSRNRTADERRNVRLLNLRSSVNWLRGLSSETGKDRRMAASLF